ncbi:MAG: hypothetical protein Q7S87_19035 [Agitococcus sp.]|nr:hypothetical protein [Agitococcus sp.]
MPSFHPLRRRSHHIALVLGVLLPAYFLVVIGLFNWLPMLWLGGHGHQLVVEDKGQIVEWVIHDHSKDCVSDLMAHAINYTLTVPCDDEGKSGLNAELDKLPIISLSLWIWFAIWCLPLTRLHHRIPLPAPICRNSLPFLRRTMVMRH